MADENSFDIVSAVNMQEVDNAVNQANKEISQRFDFKGSKSSIELSKEKGEITVVSDDDYKIKSVIDILQSRLVKRGVSLKSLTHGAVEQAGGNSVRQLLTLQQGIHQDKAREIVKFIKSSKIKVSAEIKGDQLRIRGKKRDDLQAVISLLKEKDFAIYMEFVNYR